MSVQAMSWVFDNSEAKYSDRLVLLAIANHCDRYGRNAWPKQTTIAAEARVSVREVIRAIDSLRKSGELTVEVGAGEIGRHKYSLPQMIKAERDKESRDKLACDDLARDHQSAQTAKGSPLNVTGAAGNKEEPSFNRPNRPDFCSKCNNTGFLHQLPHIPGPRLIRCNTCSFVGASA